MRIRRTSVVLSMAGLTILAFIAMPRSGRGQSQDAPKKEVPATIHEKDSDQRPEKSRSQKKDVKTAADPAPGRRISTPMQPARETSAAGSAKGEKSDGAKNVSVPFGTAKPSADEGQKAPPPNVPDWKVKDLGDSVRFEFSTPVGPYVWIKKKSKLNDTEKLALSNATATPAPAGSGNPPK